MRTAARILSVLLHPLWMPTLTIVLCFAIDPHLTFGFGSGYDKRALLIIYAMVFIMTAVFPLTSALMLVRTGLVSSLSMPDRRERIGPFTLALLYYMLCYYLLRRTMQHPLTMSIFFGGVLALLLTLLITLRWKISVHLVGIGGLLGAVFALMMLHGVDASTLLCLFFILAGALGTARLLASDHTPAQVYAGAALGCACVLGCAVLDIHF